MRSTPKSKQKQVGDKGPAWKGLDGTDDKKHSLDDLKQSKAMAMVFTCNTCPVAVAYEDRLIKLSTDYKDKGVAIVAINVNKDTSNDLDAMKCLAEEKSFPFAYLFDPSSQQIARDYGATCTPHVFLLDQDRKVAYMGAKIDDEMNADAVKHHHLQDAIDAVLAGKCLKSPRRSRPAAAFTMNDRRGDRLRPLAAICLVGGAATLSLFGCDGSSRNSGVDTASEPQHDATAAPPTAAKVVNLRVVDGAGFDAVIAEHRGKVVLVDFWATWCLPCIEQLPHTLEVGERLADRGLAVVTVSCDETSESTPHWRRSWNQRMRPARRTSSASSAAVRRRWRPSRFRPARCPFTSFMTVPAS